MKEEPYVSIVVPTYNDARSIESSLRTLIRQSYPRKEVIVVDDGSTDNTTNILDEMVKRNPNLRVLPIPHQGRSTARNVGYKSSKGSIILFGESDAIYKSSYVEKGVTKLMSDTGIGGVCMTGDIWKLRSTFVTECIGVESRIKRKLIETGAMKPFYAWMYRREAVELVGGFDEQLSQAEDTDFFQRIEKKGYNIDVVPGINWRHRRDQTTWTFIKRCFIGGKARVLYVAENRKWMELFKGVSLFWLFLVAAASIPEFQFLTYGVLFLAIIVFLYQLLLTLKIGWKYTDKKYFLFLLPLFSGIRYFSTAIGYTYGLFAYLYRKIRRAKN